ncbi:MAG TPA: hypothetical protein RMH99_03490 [Sandaracinaceae bacterium LLY-WYZ-13_1]|nr:hypothetical protein [Sandaracinaceae bacterium LLY-WYZ-13_1]
MRRLLLLSLSLLALGCDDPAPARPDAGSDGAVFIALQRDFEGFRDWTRFAVDSDAVPVGHPPGPSFIYVNRMPPEGVRRFPVGTILIKTIESGSPQEWAIHGMVKRSSDFAATTGLIGWELFELRFDDEERPVILWRGEGPPSGMGYAAPIDGGIAELVCSDCHAAAWTNDSVLNEHTRLAY